MFVPRAVNPFLSQRIVLEGVEHGGEVALAGIGQQYYDPLALVLRALGYLCSCEGGSTTGDAYQQTVLCRQLTARADGIIILHVEYLVDDVGSIGLRHEAGA